MMGVKLELPELLLDECLAGYWDWYIDEDIEKISDNFKKILGYHPEEISDDLTYRKSLIHPDDILGIERSYERHVASRGKSPYRNEMRFIHKSGVEMWFLCSGKIVEWNDDGSPSRMVGCYIDIANQKQAESNLQKAVDNRAELFRSMREGFAYGKLIYNSEGKAVDWTYNEVNLAFQRIMNITYEEAVGNSMRVHLQLPEDQFQAWLSMFESVSQRGSLKESIEQTHYSKTLSKWIQVSVFSPKAGEFGAVFQDVSKRVEAQKGLDDSLRVLESQNSRLFNFAHIVSHNLRTHAANLAMLLNIYEMEEMDAEEKMKAFSQMRYLSNTFTETVKELEKVAQVQTQMDLELHAVDLLDNINGALNTLRGDIKKVNAEIKIELKSNYKVIANEAYLQSILLNLLSNAIKYRHPIRPLQIRIWTELEGEYLKINVQDNGRGMDLTKVKKKLFGLHNTFHGNEDARGVGLFITRSQIESMGGDITVDSSLDNGSTFTVELYLSKS